MRREIPFNNVRYDYEKVLKEFVAQLQDKLGQQLVMVYLTGSYALGDATDHSDIDIFCIFDIIDPNVLTTVGFCARNTSIPYEVLEINVQSMSVEEYKSKYFKNWSEYAVSELNSVILHGNELVSIHNIKEDLNKVYKKSLADVIMSIRHYICVDKPKEKLTHDRINTYVLKPLMFALRLERFCKTGIYPLTINDLLASYSDSNKILIEYYINKDKFERDIDRNHKDVLINIHNLVCALL